MNRNTNDEPTQRPRPRGRPFSRGDRMTRTRCALPAAAALLLAVGLAASTFAQAQTIQINGAGATFPAPIYTKWFSEYHKLHPNVQINYQAIGSGGGIRQI